MNFVTVQSKCKGHAVIKWNIKNLNFVPKPYKICCLGSISVELIRASFFVCVFIWTYYRLNNLRMVVCKLRSTESGSCSIPD